METEVAAAESQRNGKTKKVQVFKTARAKKWTAILTFPDGVKEVETPHTDRKRAIAAGVGLWVTAARQKGLIASPTGRRVSKRRPSIIKFGTETKSNGTIDTTRLDALLAVMKALQGCTLSERHRILTYAIHLSDAQG